METNRSYVVANLHELAVYTLPHVCIRTWYCKLAAETEIEFKLFSVLLHSLDMEEGEEAYASDNGELGPGPSKRAKTGASTYQTRFNRDWMKTWPFIQEVK